MLTHTQSCVYSWTSCRQSTWILLLTNVGKHHVVAPDAARMLASICDDLTFWSCYAPLKSQTWAGIQFTYGHSQTHGYLFGCLHYWKLELFCRWKNFLYVFFGTHRKIMIFLSVSKYPDRKIRKPTEKWQYTHGKNQHSQKNATYSVGSLKTHRKNIYTHRKNIIFLSVILKRTEKTYTRTEKTKKSLT